uniref:ubiquitinyl hydrolase 1 n=1 Tax=Pipistrellus kuhlii TaxID=59472 RepID=A0A7J7RTM1_PIPKU|nr:OTU deubiquitinase, ubiquitin aldehyde binding 1 [Pipistrellus kuhlii]
MAAEEPQQQKQEPLGSDAEGVNCLAYDEAIMAQQDRIQQEIAVQNPLVSERLELSVLYKEYAEDDNIYQQKIKDLHKKYSYIRKTRPDGNCFYRAFGFSHLEALLDDSKELQRFKAVSAKSKEDLVAQGFTEFTIEDFHNTFMDLIEQVEKHTSVADLLASFNDQSTSDYLVVYLRLLTSGYLQRESTSSPRAPSPRSTCSTGLDTTTSSTNRAGSGAAALLPSPLPGTRHVQRFLCGCKWSCFTPPSLSYNPPRFIKGDAGGEPVCVSLLCCCRLVLCVWLTPPPPPPVGSSALHLSPQSLPAVLRG